MRFLKRLLVVLAVLLLGVVIFCAVGARKLHTAPDFYKPVAFSDAEQKENAAKATNTYIRMHQMVASALASERRDGAAGEQSGGPAASRPVGDADVQEFVFSEDELNAELLEWSGKYKDKYGPYLEDPRIILEDGKLILAAQLKQGADTILSVHLAPSLDAAGQLVLEIDSIRGGTLPLPQVFFSKYQKQVEDWLHTKLALWQAGAKLDESGAANGDAVAASTGKLILNMLHHEPSPAVLFLGAPGAGKNSPPARLRRVAVEDRKLKLGLAPMNASERQELIGQIRKLTPSAVAAK